MHLLEEGKTTRQDEDLRKGEETEEIKIKDIGSVVEDSPRARRFR
jgi:hypothetical protein